MEYLSFSDDEAGEKTRNRYRLAFFLKLLWTSLTLFALFGALLSLTIFFGWWTFILPCLLGLLAGISLTAGVLISLQNRALLTLLLGVLTLPGLAVFLSFMAASNPQAYEASSAALMPFVVYASAVLVGNLIIMKIWRNMPVREGNKEEEKGPTPVLTPAKEPTSHERSDLDKAA